MQTMDVFPTDGSRNIESCRPPCGFTSEKESFTPLDIKTKLKCPYCCSAFRKTIRIAKHLATEHLDYAPYRCPFPQCRQSRYSRRKLSEHINAKGHGPSSHFYYEEDEEKRTKLDNIVKGLMNGATFDSLNRSNKRCQSRIDEREQVDVTVAHESVGPFAQFRGYSWSDPDAPNGTTHLIQPAIEEEVSILEPVKFDDDNSRHWETPNRKRKRESAGSPANDQDVIEECLCRKHDTLDTEGSDERGPFYAGVISSKIEACAANEEENDDQMDTRNSSDNSPHIDGNKSLDNNDDEANITEDELPIRQLQTARTNTGLAYAHRIYHEIVKPAAKKGRYVGLRCFRCSTYKQRAHCSALVTTNPDLTKPRRVGKHRPFCMPDKQKVFNKLFKSAIIKATSSKANLLLSCRELYDEQRRKFESANNLSDTEKAQLALFDSYKSTMHRQQQQQRILFQTDVKSTDASLKVVVTQSKKNKVALAVKGRTFVKATSSSGGLRLTWHCQSKSKKDKCRGKLYTDPGPEYSNAILGDEEDHFDNCVSKEGDTQAAIVRKKLKKHTEEPPFASPRAFFEEEAEKASASGYLADFPPYEDFASLYDNLFNNQRNSFTGAKVPESETIEDLLIPDVFKFTSSVGEFLKSKREGADFNGMPIKKALVDAAVATVRAGRGTVEAPSSSTTVAVIPLRGTPVPGSAIKKGKEGEREKAHIDEGSVTEEADYVLSGLLEIAVGGDQNRFFLGATDGNNSFVFAAPWQLDILAQSECIQCDGASASCPSRFQQFWTIYAWYKEVLIPVAFVLSLTTTKELTEYELVFEVMKSGLARDHGHDDYYSTSNKHRIRPRRIICDFESGLWPALTKCFPLAQIQGCYYHLNHATHAKFLSCGLREFYRNDADLRNLLRMLFIIPLLPSERMHEGLDLISGPFVSSHLRALYGDKLKIIFRYYRNQWLNRTITHGDVTVRVADSINIYKGKRKTNTNIEGYNDGVRCKNPLRFLKSLQQGEVLARLKHCQVDAGVYRLSNDTTYKTVNDQIDQLYADFDNNIIPFAELVKGLGCLGETILTISL